MFKIADNFALPAGAVADTIAAVGTRGSGKTYLAGKIVEAFIDGGAQVVVIDPVSTWFGLRLAADGKGKGLDIPVFGGIHGDIPLEPGAGEIVARLVAEQRMSAVLDISEFTMTQQRRFVVAFARELFEAKKRNRSPIHLVLEEAHEFLPQQVDAGAAEMVGVVKRLWKIGRNFGIGGMLISQRIAEMSKSALNLSTYMFAGKLKGPQDRKAIEGWARDQDADDRVLSELPTLPRGTMLAWGDHGAVRIRANPKRTFDSSKTPEAGDPTAAATLPKIDLVAIRAAMAEVAAAEDEHEQAARPNGKPDPRVANLERELAELRSRPAERVEVFPREMVDKLRIVSTEAADLTAHLRDLAQMAGLMTEAPRPFVPMSVGYTPANNGHANGHLAARRPLDEGSTAEAGDGAMRMLRALAARHPTPLTEQQVAVLAGMSRKGGTYRTYRGKLTGAGLAVKDGDFLRITEKGLQAAGPVPRPRRPEELLAMWRPRFQGKARDLLEMLAANGSQPIAKADALKRIGLDPAGGTARTYWGQLSGCGLIERAQGGFRAVESLRLAS
jgi:hypothetical protein